MGMGDTMEEPDTIGRGMRRLGGIFLWVPVCNRVGKDIFPTRRAARML